MSICRHHAAWYNNCEALSFPLLPRGHLAAGWLMPNPYAPDRLAALVRRAAKLDGISIAELSRRSGVGRVTLQRWLTGVRGIRIGDAIRVLDALGAVVTVGRSQPERFPKSGGARAKKSAEGQ